MLSRAAICRVTTGATLFGFLILACALIDGGLYIASLLAAVFDIVCIVVYFIAAGKLESVIGNKSKSGKSIVVLSRRIAMSLLVAIRTDVLHGHQLPVDPRQRWRAGIYIANSVRRRNTGFIWRGTVCSTSVSRQGAPQPGATHEVGAFDCEPLDP